VNRTGSFPSTAELTPGRRTPPTGELAMLQIDPVLSLAFAMHETKGGYALLLAGEDEGAAVDGSSGGGSSPHTEGADKQRRTLASNA
jgi:hypothetical protein